MLQSSDVRYFSTSEVFLIKCQNNEMFRVYIVLHNILLNKTTSYSSSIYLKVLETSEVWLIRFKVIMKQNKYVLIIRCSNVSYASIKVEQRI